MKIIEKIEIHRFRSISDVSFKADEITIFSGINNSGKSNILRALNLFFNGQSSFDQQYDFEKDYNKAFTGKAGGKRAIKITLHFKNQGTAALKGHFSISRTFQLGQKDSLLEYCSENPEIQKSIEKKDGNITRQFTRFLNKIEYFYIPAVRGKNFVRNLFLHFEKLIEHDSGSDFKDKMNELSNVLQRNSQDISADFEKFIDLPTQANLSSKITDILGTVEVNIKTGIKVLRHTKNAPHREDVYVNLFSSGDGILMSYLAYFLAHICKKISNQIFIWGFEEPENSLEYSKVQKIAQDFLVDFKQNAQIFITTHSPAFVKLNTEQGVIFYRVYINSDDMKQSSLIKSIQEIETRRLTLLKTGDIETSEYKKLGKELYLVEFAIEIENAVKKVNEVEKELLTEKNKFQQKYEQIIKTQPTKIFICEDSDNKIIRFWEYLLKLYGLEDVKVMTSNGCTNTLIETGVRYQNNLDNAYCPKIFRQIDRDSLTEEQINFIKDNLFNKVTEGLNYKYQYLPVNEIENFAVLINDQFTDDFWESNRIELEDIFSISAHSTCLNLFSKFRNEPLFNVHNNAKITQPMKNFARTDWKKYFPGKEICAKIAHFNPISFLRSKSKAKLPDELKAYMDNIISFFNNNEPE